MPSTIRIGRSSDSSPAPTSAITSERCGSTSPGKLAELVPLANEVLPPFDIAWSPAGYLVLASAEKTDNFASQFLVQAFWPGGFMPVWHYGQAEQPNWHVAQALAIGPGVIVAGGFGGLGYPALAYINP